jgi:hypothetical protein
MMTTGTATTDVVSAINGSRGGLPAQLLIALKEWAVAIRALREGRQILLLRKGGIREAGGEFEVESRNVLLFPTYIHADEQPNALQPCYEAYRRDEDARRPDADTVRMEACAQVTDILIVRNFDALYRLHNQHIYSDEFLRFRVENDPHKLLYCLFLRAYDLPHPVTIPLEPDYYGCKSWINLTQSISTAGAVPAMRDAAYDERVRVTKRFLTSDGK